MNVLIDAKGVAQLLNVDKESPEIKEVLEKHPLWTVREYEKCSYCHGKGWTVKENVAEILRVWRVCMQEEELSQGMDAQDMWKEMCRKEDKK